MCRLMQNRKSAKKCRLKKKAEFGQMRGDVTKLQDENKVLKDKVRIAYYCLFYYSKSITYISDWFLIDDVFVY